LNNLQAERSEDDATKQDNITNKFLFHVKSAYESMGALKREINFYKEYHDFDKAYHFVVGPRTPDIEKELKQIDCGFIEAPAELVKIVETIKKEEIKDKLF
jgi:hypothetical protein